MNDGGVEAARGCVETGGVGVGISGAAGADIAGAAGAAGAGIVGAAIGAAATRTVWTAYLESFVRV